MPMKLSTLLIAAMMFFAFSLFAQMLRSDLKFSLDLTPAQAAFIGGELASGDVDRDLDVGAPGQAGPARSA